MRVIRLTINWTIFLSMPLWFPFLFPFYAFGILSEAIRYRNLGIKTHDSELLFEGNKWFYER